MKNVCIYNILVIFHGKLHRGRQAAPSIGTAPAAAWGKNPMGSDIMRISWGYHGDVIWKELGDLVTWLNMSISMNIHPESRFAAVLGPKRWSKVTSQLGAWPPPHVWCVQTTPESHELSNAHWAGYQSLIAKNNMSMQLLPFEILTLTIWLVKLNHFVDQKNTRSDWSPRAKKQHHTIARNLDLFLPARLETCVGS